MLETTKRTAFPKGARNMENAKTENSMGKMIAARRKELGLT